MAVKNKMFQPGAILHEVVVGCFRASGTSFDDWCRTHNVHPSTARNATHGQSRGAKGTALLNRMIDAADREAVEAAYQKRMIMEAKRLEGAAA